MNTHRSEETKGESRVVTFVDDVFNVLGKDHEERFDTGRNKQSDYFERLSNAVEVVSEETGYDYTDIEDYEKRLLADNNVIKEVKENLMKNEKLKGLIEEYKTIPGKSKGMEIKIWKKIFLDLVYESIDDVGEENEGNMKNMSFNNIGDLSGEELRKVLSCLPKDLKILHLWNNNLGNLSGEELSKTLSSLPKDLKILHLGINNLGELAGEDLGKALSCLPKDLKNLDLQCNNIGELSGEDLRKALSGLPKDLESLELVDNNLGNLSGEELKKVLSCLPKDLKSLYLRGNNLCECKKNIINKTINGNNLFNFVKRKKLVEIIFD